MEESKYFTREAVIALYDELRACEEALFDMIDEQDKPEEEQHFNTDLFEELYSLMFACEDYIKAFSQFYDTYMKV